MDPFFDYLHDLEGQIGEGDFRSMVRGLQALKNQPINIRTREEILKENHPSKLFDVLQTHDLLSQSKPHTLIMLLQFANLHRLAKHVGVRFEKGFDRHYSFEEVEREADMRESQPTGQEGNQQRQPHLAVVASSATNTVEEWNIAGIQQYHQQPTTSAAAEPNTSMSAVPLNNQPKTVRMSTQSQSVLVPLEVHVSDLLSCDGILEKERSGNPPDSNEDMDCRKALFERTHTHIRKSVATTMYGSVKCPDGWSKTPLYGAKEGQPFEFPQGLAFVGNRLAICDTDKNVVQIINRDYLCELELGTFDGRFPKPFRPVNVAVSKYKHYFIIDEGNLQIVVCDETSKIINLINLPGANEPRGIALQRESILVTDAYGFKLMKFKLSIHGKFIEHRKDGVPYSVAVNSNDDILVTQYTTGFIECLNDSLKFLHKYDCTPGNANFKHLHSRGIAIDEGNNIYICNWNNNVVVKLRPDGKWECTPFEMYQPEYISVAKDGRIAVTYGGSGSKEIVIFTPC